MTKKHTLKDVQNACIIEVDFEFGENDLFERISKDKWHHEHWGRKNIWEYEEDDVTDLDVLNGYINNYPEKVRFVKSNSLKSHSCKAPTKKCKFVCPEKMF